MKQIIDKLKNLSNRLNKVNEKLSEVDFEIEVNEYNKIDRKYESIKKNN
jgi:hypothetical protein